MAVYGSHPPKSISRRFHNMQPLEGPLSGNRRHQRGPHVRQAWLIAAFVFFSYAYFYGGGGWNQDSRFDLVRAIVEQRTLRIDRYQDNTGDKAFFDGHYYSDKAPGTALLASPFVALARAILQLKGRDPESPSSLRALSYIANLVHHRATICDRSCNPLFAFT